MDGPSRAWDLAHCEPLGGTLSRILAMAEGGENGIADDTEPVDDAPPPRTGPWWLMIIDGDQLGGG